MTLPDDFIRSLTPVEPSEIARMIRDRVWPKGGGTIELRDEIRPVDTFCYLGARFGPPNGFQNALRTDSSDNLIHWEWVARHRTGVVTFQGMNFRTEVSVSGPEQVDPSDATRVASQIRAEFVAFGQAMGAIRLRLEHWVEFVNPYQRIRRASNRLLDELDALELDPDADRIQNTWLLDDAQIEERWTNTAQRYAKGFGLAFAVRAILPVLAESYVNLLLFILMRPELQNDERLRENAVRQPIDIRIKSLHLTCTGFQSQPDYGNDTCKAFHRLVNARNDLLHGNLVVDKLKFNEVYFLGKVPIFRDYRSMWERALEVEQRAVGLTEVHEELAVVDALIAYLESCLEPRVRRDMKLIADSFELGLNSATNRIGLLFSQVLTDMRMGPPTKGDGSSGVQSPPA